MGGKYIVGIIGWWVGLIVSVSGWWGICMERRRCDKGGEGKERGDV